MYRSVITEILQYIVATVPVFWSQNLWTKPNFNTVLTFYIFPSGKIFTYWFNNCIVFSFWSISLLFLVFGYKMHLACPLRYMDFTMRLKLVRSGAHEPWNSTKANRSTPTSEVNPPNGPIRCIQNMGTRWIHWWIHFKKSIKITRENP